MSRSTDDLISTLSTSVAPVHRLSPPLLRAGVTLGVVLALTAALVLAFGRMHGFLGRMSDARFAVEIGATLLTGLSGVVAAFHLSLPDRPRAWAWLPAPFALLWLAMSGLGCWTSWIRFGDEGLGFGETFYCFGFILAASLPIGGLVLWGLSKARPLQPGLTLAVGGLGAAALCAFVLQFFHPAGVKLIDLVFHASAVAVIVAVSGLIGRKAMAG